jgi:hypothetical protein
MLDFSFERCDGHHETVDLKLRKKPRSGRALDLQRERQYRGAFHHSRPAAVMNNPRTLAKNDDARRKIDADS